MLDDWVTENNKRKTKVGWSYMDPLVYGQDAWPSCCCRKATAYTSFAFGSTILRRQLTEMIYGFQGYGSHFGINLVLCE